MSDFWDDFSSSSNPEFSKEDSGFSSNNEEDSFWNNGAETDGMSWEDGTDDDFSFETPTQQSTIVWGNDTGFEDTNTQQEVNQQSQEVWNGNQEIQQQQYDWNNDIGNNPNSNTPQDNTQQSVNIQPPKFSYKMVGIIIGAGCVILALVFFILSRISISQKQTTTQPQQVQQSAQVVQQAGKSLVSIPDSTALDYSAPIQTTSGVVTGKLKYLDNHQVVYCLVISAPFKSQTISIDYYCNFNSFSSVNIGDTLNITYQEVQDGYIGLVEISR